MQCAATTEHGKHSSWAHSSPFMPCCEEQCVQTDIPRAAHLTAVSVLVGRHSHVQHCGCCAWTASHAAHVQASMHFMCCACTGCVSSKGSYTHPPALWVVCLNITTCSMCANRPKFQQSHGAHAQGIAAPAGTHLSCWCCAGEGRQCNRVDALLMGNFIQQVTQRVVVHYEPAGRQRQFTA